MKKATTTKTWIPLALLGGASLLGSTQQASAQAATPGARFSVDLKDATLRDALELVFQAAGNPSHVIDPAASQVRIGSVSFKDQEWRDIVRTLANLNKFSFRRENGLWIVAPRTTSSTRSASFFRTSVAANATMTASQYNAPKFAVETRSSAQQNTGGGTGGGTGTGNTLDKPAAVDSNNPWTIIEPLHIYAGTIALFFEGGTAVTTEAFIVPSSGLVSHLGGALLPRPGYVRGGITVEKTTTNSNNNNNNNNNNNGGTTTTR